MFLLLHRYLLASVCFTVMCSAISSSQIGADEYQLNKDLFSNYNKRVRPVKYHAQLLQVTFEMALFDIIQLNTREQTLATNTEIIMHWNDSNLVWDPQLYNGTKIIHIPYADIWYPDIILYNTADMDYRKSIMNTNAIVRHTGEVALVSHAMLQSSCSVDISWYPFDQQECTLLFASWTYDSTKIKLIKNRADLSEYRPNPEFFLENFYAETKEQHDPCCEEPFSAVVYHFQLQRRTHHPVFFYVLPGVIVCICAHMGFLLPADCGEKISLAMSCLVAMMVFLMSVTLDIPPSTTLPLIGRYYFACIVILGSNLIVCVISLKFRHDKRCLSDTTRWIVKFLGRLCFLSPPKYFDRSCSKASEVKKVVSPTVWEEKSESVSTPSRVNSNRPQLNKEPELITGNTYEVRSLKALEHIQSTLVKKLLQDKSSSCQSTEALYFCQVLDRCFFFVLVVCTLAFNLELFLASPHSYSFRYCPRGHGNCPPDWNYQMYENLIESGQGLSQIEHK